MYRARTAKAAQQAALQGEAATEWDTQSCVALQQEILSSSPVVAPLLPPLKKVASGTAVARQRLHEFEIDAGGDATSVAATRRNADVEGKSTTSCPTSPEHAARVATVYDSKRGLRHPLGESPIPPRVRATMVAVMEDLTQKSSSLTQENPESVYERYNLQPRGLAQYTSTTTPDNEEGDGEEQMADLPPPYESPSSKHHTESTAYTYQENDAGHIKLGFELNPDDLMIEDDSDSQDASAPALEADQHPHGEPMYEPETPAQPQNPFSHKGIVMKPQDLFGATQPSVVGRHFTSPASSRPSPDVYCGSSSPAKRRRLAVSPTSRTPLAVVQTSPLQSSVRRILNHSTSEELSTEESPARVSRNVGVQSFDNSLHYQPISSIEPRPYVSMKESQERRRRTDSLSGSDTEDSDGDLSLERRRRAQRERIQRDLSIVKAIPKSEVPSSRPETPAVINGQAEVEVEVPSTSRRRSSQDHYIAQYDNSDNRNIHRNKQNPPTSQPIEQADVIVDSQGVRPAGLGAESSVANSPVAYIEQDISATANHKINTCEPETTSQPDATKLRVIEREAAAEVQAARALQSDILFGREGSLSLPLQDISSNMRPQVDAKANAQSDNLTVPETSPAQRLRSMGEIANISFANDEPLDIPQFTQDVEYDNVMGIRSSPPRNSVISDLPSTTRQAQLQTREINDIGIDVIQAQCGDAGTAQPSNGQTARSRDQGISSLPTEASTLAQAPFVDENPESKSPLITPRRGASRIKKYGKGRTMLLQEQEDAPTSNSSEPGHKSDILPRGSSGPSRLSGSVSSTSVKQATRSSQRKSMEGLVTGQILTPTPDDHTTKTSPRNSTEVYEKAETSVAKLVPSSPRKSLAKNSKKPTQKALNKRTNKRSLRASKVQDPETPSLRSSKRKSGLRDYKEDSEDPLALLEHDHSKDGGPRPLFDAMAFVVSYVKHGTDRDNVTALISGNGGLVLEDGFESLFEDHGDETLLPSSIARSLTFVAAVADEHSRKAKYLQALALGLPCISGRWIQNCLHKKAVLGWEPYLLCAGQSSFLGKAFLSRHLTAYSASDASLPNTVALRDKLLEGKSILIIIGKGKSREKRKAFIFLARALGPTRIGQAVDFADARNKLHQGETEGQLWDLVHVEDNEEAAESAILEIPSASALTKKRKRGQSAVVDVQQHAPKTFRIISDETMIQSLIFGRLIEED